MNIIVIFFTGSTLNILYIYSWLSSGSQISMCSINATVFTYFLHFFIKLCNNQLLRILKTNGHIIVLGREIRIATFELYALSGTLLSCNFVFFVTNLLLQGSGLKEVVALLHKKVYMVFPSWSYAIRKVIYFNHRFYKKKRTLLRSFILTVFLINFWCCKDKGFGVVFSSFKCYVSQPCM